MIPFGRSGKFRFLFRTRNAPALTGKQYFLANSRIAAPGPAQNLSAHRRASTVTPFRFENAKVAWTTTYEVKSNWKISMENYRECYHCLTNHPEFCATVPVGRGAALHQNTANIRIIHAPNLTFSNYPLRPGAGTQSIDGELASIPFGDLKLTDELIASLPNYYLNFYSAHGFVFNLDYAMTFSVHPRDARGGEDRRRRADEGVRPSPGNTRAPEIDFPP